MSLALLNCSSLKSVSSCYSHFLSLTLPLLLRGFTLTSFRVNTPIYLDSSDALLGSTWYFECPDEFPISSLRITLSFGGSQFEIPFGYLVSAERVLTQEGKTICSLLPQSVPNEGDAFVIGQGESVQLMGAQFEAR